MLQQRLFFSLWTWTISDSFMFHRMCAQSRSVAVALSTHTGEKCERQQHHSLAQATAAAETVRKLSSFLYVFLRNAISVFCLPFHHFILETSLATILVFFISIFFPHDVRSSNCFEFINLSTPSFEFQSRFFFRSCLCFLVQLVEWINLRGCWEAPLPSPRNSGLHRSGPPRNWSVGLTLKSLPHPPLLSLPYLAPSPHPAAGLTQL